MIGYTYSDEGVKSMMRLGVFWTFVMASVITAVGLGMFIVKGEGMEIVAVGVGLVPVALGAKVGQKAIEEK